MFDDLKIRNKLILLVAGPIVVLVLLAGLGATARQATADESRTVEQLVAIAQANARVVDRLQLEALASSAHIASGRSAWDAELAEAREATDDALGDAVERLRGERGTSAAYRSSSTQALDAVDKLVYIRDAIDQGYTWEQAVTTLATTQSSFLAVNDAVAAAVPDPEVGAELRTGAALAAYKSAIARQGAYLVGAGEDGGFVPDASFGLFREAAADEVSQRAIFGSIADTTTKGAVRDALTSEARTTFEGIVGVATTVGADADPAIAADAVTEASTGVVGALHGVETALFEAQLDASRSARDAADRAANLFLLAAGLALVVAIAGAVLLGRRITRPLQTLTVAADRLSNEQMPRLVESLRNPTEDELDFQLGSMQAIEITSGDEIGRLASSFNDVQRVAGEVAAEQAALLRKGIGEMFVNLARRNQGLLDRQIEFIDELERSEEDPDQLENLYRLDHLATRMRRNAESLLVLAGAEPPRRRGRPAPLANVVRAALAEVEDFGRIELLSFDEVLVASNAAADLAHLLSELMENATNFSPPETRVEVVGHRTKAGGYVVSVTDHGIGMSADQISDANEALAKPPLVGLALSRSLGFIVVGRLAGRHGVAVRMMPSPSGGVTAVVSLPPSLVTEGPGAVAAPGPIDLDRAAAAEAHHPAEAPTEVAGPASSAPLAFTPFDHQDAPASLDEAVPSGAAFDAGLDALVNREAPAASGPSASDSTGTGANGLPTRRLTARPAGADAGDATPAEPAPAGAEATPVPAPPEVSDASVEPAGVPGALAFAPDPVHSSPDVDAPAAPPVEPLPASAPAPSGTVGSEAGGPARLDGAPPAIASLPSRAATPRPPVPSATSAPADGGSRPFFLEDATPPRLFGRAPETTPETRVPAAPDSGAPRLFGGPPAPAAVPPVPVPPAEPTAPGGASPASPPGPVRTTSGLAKRTPRADGDARAIPGADGERGAGATRRSPDEVRNLLSSYRAGQQRARSSEPVPTGPADERETHE